MKEDIVTRNRDADLMRIIASVGVIAMHSISAASITGIVCLSVVHFCVPVFVMISGYYMLSKPRSYREILRRCARLFFWLVAWAAIQYMAALATGEMTWDGIGRLLWVLLSAESPLWYLYLAMGLYIFTPFLYVFCSNADQKTYRISLIIMFILGSICFIAVRWGIFPLLNAILEQMKAPLYLGFIFLYMLGDYFRRYPLKSPAYWYAAFPAGIIMTLVWSLLLPREKVYLLPMSFFAPGNMLAAIGFFVMIKEFWKKRPLKSPKGLKVLDTLAGASGGIYLSHYTFILLIGRLMEPFLTMIPYWLYGLILIACVYVASLILTLILKRIPGLRTLVK